MRKTAEEENRVESYKQVTLGYEKFTALDKQELRIKGSALIQKGLPAQENKGKQEQLKVYFFK